MNSSDVTNKNPNEISLQINDINSPYDFKTWTRTYRNTNTIDELDDYNQYLVKWFENKANIKNDRVIQLKKRFLRFLKEIQAFFSKKEALQWYNTIDINNERHVAIAIPYFAKKLREISEYYRNKRSEVKRSKIKHSLVGTKDFLEKTIKQSLIELLDTKPFNIHFDIDTTIWENLSGVNIPNLKENLRVEIKELYDDTDYFTEDASIIEQGTLHKFLTSKSFTLTDDWVLESHILLDEFETVYTQEAAFQVYDIAKNILPFDVTSVKLTSSSPEVVTKEFSIPLLSGKTFFNWPDGTFELDNRDQYEPIALSSSMFQVFGKSDPDYKLADTIFVNDNGSVSAAWLCYTQYITSDKKMEAAIAGSEVTFKFPFPGYGLSASDVNWTGREYKTTKSFAFMTAAQKQATQLAYWDYTDPVLSSVDIPISKSDIIKYATPSKDYSTADKVRKYGYLPLVTDVSLSGDFNEAWLYKFTDTNIPISVLDNNLIIWPYTITTSASSVNVPSLDQYICEPKPVSALKTNFFIAGSSYETSDIIFKIHDFKNPIDTIIEAAWLSGNTININGCEYIEQTSFNFVINAGDYSMFVWPGLDMQISDVFSSTLHHKNCPYTQKDLSYIESLSCNCGAVNLSPFGHNGTIYDAYNRKADFIMLIDNPLKPVFDLSLWRGSDGKDYSTSKDFAWFTTASTTSSLSWNGNWTRDITLSAGKCYCYFRANYDGTEPDVDYSMPFLRCNRVLLKNTTPKWIGLTLDSDGVWSKSTSTDSEMLLSPGNGILIQRKNTITYNTLSSLEVEKEIVSAVSSVWSNDYVTTSDTVPVIISFPPLIDFIPSDQTPDFNTLNVQTAYWSISTCDINGVFLNQSEMFNNTQIVSFLPKQEGTYKISVTADVLSSYEEVYETGTTENTTTSDVELKVFTSNAYLSYAIIDYNNNTYTNSGNYIISSIQGIDEANTIDIDIFELPVYGVIVMDKDTPVTGKLNSYSSYGNIQSGVYKLYRELPSEPTLITVMSSIDITTTTTATATRTVDITVKKVFNGIPSITAVNPIATEYTQIPRTYNTCGFIWSERLYGWDYNINNKGKSTSIGARPFWAKSEDNNNILDGGTAQIKFDAEMNAIKQPKFSDIIFSYEDYITYYNTGNKSFVWYENIKQLSTINEVKWNKLVVDSVYSDDYDLLTTEITPTQETSEIILQTYTANSPQKIFYFANDDTVLTFTLTALNLNKNQIENSIIINNIEPLQAVTPYKNIFNNKNIKILTYPNLDNLYEKDNTYISDLKLNPIAFACPTFTTTIKEPTTANTKYITFNRAFGDSQFSGYDLDTENFSWLKHTPESQEAAGNIHSDVYKKYQNFIPYRSSNNNQKHIHTPWLDRKNTTVWIDNNFVFNNNRGLVDTDIWKNNQFLSINDYKIINETDDIYGNRYTLCSTTNSKGVTLSSLWVTCENGSTVNSTKKLSSYISNINSFSELSDINDRFLIIDKHYGCFIDTLYTCVLDVSTKCINLFFNKLTYDFSTSEIHTSISDTRYYNSSASFISLSKKYLDVYNNEKTTFILSNEWVDIQKSKMYFSIISNYNEDIVLTLLTYDINKSLRSFDFIIDDELLVKYNIKNTLTNIFNNIKKTLIYQDNSTKHIHITTYNVNCIFSLILNENEPYDIKEAHLIQTYKNNVFNIIYNKLNISVQKENLSSNISIDVFDINSNGFIQLGSNITKDDIIISSNSYDLTYNNNIITINKDCFNTEAKTFDITIDSRQVKIYQSLTVNII